MRKPAPLIYLFGNPVTLLAAIGGTGFFGYQWWSSDGSLLPAIIAFLVMCQSINATAQLQKYNDWKREWDAVEGKRPAGTLRIRFAWTPLTRFLVGVPAWGVGAYGMLTVPMGDDFFANMARAAFWSGSALALVILIYRAFRLVRKPSAKAVPKPTDPCVLLCLAPPKSSPSLPDAYRQLPGYCKGLIC